MQNVLIQQAPPIAAASSASAPERFPTLSNGTDATNDINFTAAFLWDSTFTESATIGALVKQLDANWAAGTNAGMRNSAAAITDTTYHIYACWKPSGADPDYYAHTSATVATVLTALQAETGGGDYDYLQRVGSIIRASSAIVLFTQRGKMFTRSANALDGNPTSTAATAVTLALSVPVGISVVAQICGDIHNASIANVLGMASSLDQADAAVNNTNTNMCTPATGIVGSYDLHVATNTSAQIRLRTNNATASNIYTGTKGWEDFGLRGHG